MGRSGEGEVMSGMKFVLKVPAPDAVGAFTSELWGGQQTWPIYDLDYGRQVARECKLGGIWRVKQSFARGSDTYERRIAAAQWALLDVLG